MAFKDIHKLKKIIEVQKEFIEVEHLVIGKDIFSQSVYRTLVSKYGEAHVRLLSEDPITRADVFLKGPSTIRGEENKNVIRNLFPDIEVSEVSAPSLFFKDLIWKPFGGRSKSEALKFDEEFYVSSRLNINDADLFSWFDDSSEYLENLNKIAYQVKIKSIHYKDERFYVECINGTEFNSKYVYFGKAAYSFLQSYSEKNHLSDKFIQFAESTKTIHGLFLKYIFEKPLTDMIETHFIPLSYTHEWGHFVGEFKKVPEGQSVEFLHYIDEDHTSEEEISRTIRQLKKSFEKIFQNFNKIKFQEFIAIEDEIGCLKIDDTTFSECLNENLDFMKNLFFIGVNAPLYDAQCGELCFEYSKKEVSLMARALIVEKLLQSKI